MSRKFRKTPKRQVAMRSYRKRFIISTEGAVTERLYFENLSRQLKNISIKVLRTKTASAPHQVLERMQRELRAKALSKTDEAWLVIDKDLWTDRQIDALFNWQRQHKRHGVVVSNPKFEAWVLLHFEDGHGVRTSQQCDARLSHHDPSIRKTNLPNFPLDTVQIAVKRAKNNRSVLIVDWPRSPLATTVYRLVERMLEAESDASTG